MSATELHWFKSSYSDSSDINHLTVASTAWKRFVTHVSDH